MRGKHGAVEQRDGVGGAPRRGGAIRRAGGPAAPEGRGQWQLARGRALRRGLVLALLAVLAGMVAAGPGAAAPASEIELLRVGAGRWPRPLVLELPRDFLQPGERLCLRTRAGAEVAVAVDPLSSWSAGRPRWCRLRVAELPAEARHLRLGVTRRSPGRPRLRLEGRGSQGALQAERGLGQWDAQGLRIGPFRFDGEGSTVEVDGGSEPWGLGRRPRSRGPDAAGFVLELGGTDPGAASVVDTAACWEVSSRGTHGTLLLQLRARQACVVRRWTLRGRADEAVDLIADGRRDRSRSEREILAPRASFAAPGSGGAEGAVPESVALACRGRRLVWADFSARPTAVWCDDRGRFRLGLVAEEVLLEAGQCLRRVLRFGPDQGPTEGADRDAGARALLLRSTERWILSEEESAWLTGWVSLLEREVGGCGSCEDRGCYPSADGGFANGEYDLAQGLLDLGRVTADLAALRTGLCMVEHQRCFDRAVDPPAGWPEGLFWMHGRRHRSERLEAGHVWLGGLLAAAQVGGDSGAWHDAVGVLRAVEELETQGDKLAGPERRLVWPLWAALEAADVDPRARPLAGRLLDRLLARQGAPGWIEGDLRRQQGRDFLWANSWVSLGLTVPTLLRAARVLERPDARAAARRLGGAVFEAARSRDGLAEVLLIDPVFGDCVGRRGRCRAGGAALAAAGLAALAAEGGGPAPALAATDLAGALWDRARASLSPPQREEATEFAKALHALRLLVELRRPGRAAAR